MKNAGSFSGNRPGCPGTSESLQRRRYGELLSVFGISRGFDGIAPPLFSGWRLVGGLAEHEHKLRGQRTVAPCKCRNQPIVARSALYSAERDHHY